MSAKKDKPKGAGSVNTTVDSKREFFKKHEFSVIVELKREEFVASMGTEKTLFQQLEDITGSKPLTVFSRPEPDKKDAYQPANMINAQISSDLARYVELTAKSKDNAVGLAGEIKSKMKDKVVEVLPVPLAEPALGPVSAEPTDVSTITPDFGHLQKYLGPGPDGVNALFAWQYPGGDGRDIKIIDIEGGWRLTHENIVNSKFNHWGGQIKEESAWLEHGTAVVALMGGPHDNTGVNGISPGAIVGMVSPFDNKGSNKQRVASQILAALELMRPGDVMLLELQRPGPRNNFQSDAAQKGYIPICYWPDIRAAISTAVQSGVCVVQVAGNGGEDLDDNMYDGRFDQSKYDTGAILVGAGAPPGGMFGAARSQLEFSNYGSRLDCQCWGQTVVTAGYGDLWGGVGDENQSYTSRFMGTSSAAPLVAGLVACLQGRHKYVHGCPMPPLMVRTALNNIGWVQGDSVASPSKNRIGLQPDLMMLFNSLGLA